MMADHRMYDVCECFFFYLLNDDVDGDYDVMINVIKWVNVWRVGCIRRQRRQGWRIRS